MASLFYIIYIHDGPVKKKRLGRRISKYIAIIVI
jgi:hypothetical protein